MSPREAGRTAASGRGGKEPAPPPWWMLASEGWEPPESDKFSRWFQHEPLDLDRWIRSPCAPTWERLLALEHWIWLHPNQEVLGRVKRRRDGKYSPVAEYLRARLRDPVFTSRSNSNAVWIALARSGWLGEQGPEKSMSPFYGSAEIMIDALPQVAAAATPYVRVARAHLCSLLHSHADATTDLSERFALYGCIHGVMSAP